MKDFIVILQVRNNEDRFRLKQMYKDYLQNTPGTKKAMEDCLKRLEPKKPHPQRKPKSTLKHKGTPKEKPDKEPQPAAEPTLPTHNDTRVISTSKPQ